jgi:hypothetical protein
MQGDRRMKGMPYGFWRRRQEDTFRFSPESIEMEISARSCVLGLSGVLYGRQGPCFCSS